MAQGDEKRTYKLTDEAIAKLNQLDENSKLDKSDNVDRAIKMYYRLLLNNKIDDPYIDEEDIDGIGEINVGDGESNGGIIDRIRGKK